MKQKKGYYERFFKRVIDIAFSGIAIILLSPAFLIVAILVKIKIGSPIIFKQIRPGKEEQLFNMYKFRTMTSEKDSNGNLLPDSQRLTPFGKKLRSSSLDELPELWNIFKGDMSIVGPRPLLVKYLPYYTEKERIRHTIRPGLTGLAQINGRNTVDWNKRLELDIKYVNELSFKKDILIVLTTIIRVLNPDDVVVVDQGTIKDLDLERKND
ncbi:sugar transferase [Streptococcus hyovaginalis]|uniref:sugar transferase n=1 Tax=Streptococcus hyovaginalis TaxID=149015 RepID=UPI001478489E|nr:sugar transferase [Streptococcus hyovaginalis]